MSVNVSKGGRTRHPWGERPILLPCQRENRRKALCPLPLNQPLLSTLPALSSSWPFSFVCLSGDNGRLSVTQGLTQIHSVRRRTVVRVMGISQPFTHRTQPSQSELLAAKTRFSRKEQSQECSLASVFSLHYCRGMDWSAMQTSSNQLIRLVTHGGVLTYSWLVPWNKSH